MAEEKLFYTIEKPCPICGMTTRITKVKSRLIVESKDKDFCTHYHGVNPYFYRIWVCEHCGYAEDEKHFRAGMSDYNKEKMQQYLGEHPANVEFHEERSLEDAVQSYELALSYAEMLKAPASHLASLQLALAWVYRDAKQKDLEDATLKKAAELYDKALLTEHFPIGNLTDNMVMYLIGAIYYMLKDYEHTGQYLGRIMGDNKIRTEDRATYDLARELWQDVRAEKA